MRILIVLGWLAPVWLMAAVELVREESQDIAKLRAAAAAKPRSTEAAMALCRALMERQQWPAAAEAAQAVLKIDAKHGEALAELGWSYYKRGEREKALEACRRATTTAPGSAMTWGRLAQLYGIEGSHAAAEAAFQKGLTLHPKDAYLRALHTQFMTWKDPSEAQLKAFGALIEKHPPHEAIFRNEFGGILEQLGRHEEAFAQFREALRLRPDYALAWANLGIIFSSMMETDRYFIACQRVLEIDPWHRKTRREFAEMLILYGHVAEAKAVLTGGTVRWGDPETLLQAGIGPQAGTLYGLDAAQAALAREPDVCGRHQRLAGYLVKKGDLERALAECEEELRLFPESIAAVASRAGILMKMTRFKEAIPALREAMQIIPGPEILNADLATALDVTGDKAGAEAAYKLAAAAAEKSNVVWLIDSPVEIVWSKYALFLWAQFRYDEALVMAEKAYQAAPRNPQIRKIYADALSDAGKWREAQKIREPAS